MAIYAISDLHLSLANPKPMDIFGPTWTNHADKLRENWDSTVGEGDTVLLPGDISWAMRIREAKPDLDFIADRPGRKVLIRGNHDYWWQRKATTRIQGMIDRNLVFLQGTCVHVDGIGVTGTRGWRVDWDTAETSGEETSSPHGTPSAGGEPPDKVLRRELDYLERGLQSIQSAGLKIAMLHFPPFDEHLRPNEFAQMLADYSVDKLVYGHVHLGLGSWINGDVLGVHYYMVSADVVDFTPQLIVPEERSNGVVE